MTAAFEVFAEVGVNGASVELIAERAGYTRGAFYSNYSTKEELLIALVEREQRRRVERLQTVIQSTSDGLAPKPPAEALEEILSGFMDQYRPDITWLKFLREYQLAALRDPTVGEIFRAQESESYEQLAKSVVAALSHSGRRTVGSPVEVARTISAVMEFALQDTFVNSGDVQAAAKLASRMLLPIIIGLTEPVT
jgi:AcrR family transcriptional regulator